MGRPPKCWKPPKPAVGPPLAAPRRTNHPDKTTNYASNYRDINTHLRLAVMSKRGVALVVVITAALGAVIAAALSREQGTATASSTLSGRPVHTSAAVGRRPAPIIHRPPGLSRAKPVPLLVALHASGGLPAKFEGTSGLDAVADKRGFVVAYLGSLEPTAPAWLLSDMPANLAYISSEIKSLTRSENIDPKRVYVTGFSAGATMAYFVGCQLSSQVDGIAPVSGAMRFTDPCRLSHPVSELELIGTRDAIPIEGSARLLSATQVAARWRGLDGCASQSSSATKGPVHEQTWSRCRGVSGVRLYVINNGTHQWPGPGASGTNAQFTAASAIWAFFAAH